VLSISYPLLANIQVRQVARPYMKELADYARGWVSMGVRDRLNMVYIETARSPEVVRSRPDIGQSFPIIAASMGRAYLAGLPEPARNAVLNEIRVKTPDLWKKYAARVDEGLADFRARGFCLRQGDLVADVHSVGVPMAPQPDGDIVVFNCAVPLHILRRGQLENELGPRLVQLVRTVEGMLGLR
jgi:DNA-binding IclR family transcriptional regulator